MDDQQCFVSLIERHGNNNKGGVADDGKCRARSDSVRYNRNSRGQYTGGRDGRVDGHRGNSFGDNAGQPDIGCYRIICRRKYICLDNQQPGLRINERYSDNYARSVANRFECGT
jgi:hypothetical protein